MHHQPKILFVEDDLNNHPLYRDVFTKHGFEVVICQTAEGGFIDEIISFKPDIISMDLMIGKDNEVVERDGFDAIALLKADMRTKNIPIFVLSNFFEETKVSLARELGVVDYINLQGQTLTKIPEIILRYLEKPKKYRPTHPAFRNS